MKTAILLILVCSIILISGCSENKRPENFKNDANTNNQLTDKNITKETEPITENDLNNNSLQENNSPEPEETIKPALSVNYSLGFEKVLVSIKASQFNSSELNELILVGNTPELESFNVNGSEKLAKIVKTEYELTSILETEPFQDSNTELTYSYSPDYLPGNYCISQTCIIKIYSEIYPNSKNAFDALDDYNLIKLTRKDSNAEVFGLTKLGLVKKDGFSFFKEQENTLETQSFDLVKNYSYLLKTNTFLNKSNTEEIFLFLLPSGSSKGGEYVQGSRAIMLQVDDSEEKYKTFVHEYAHFLLEGNSFPLWIQEGMVNYVSEKVTGNKEAKIVTNINILEWGLKKFDYETTPKLYSQATLVFEYFERQFGEQKTKDLISEFESLPDDSDVYSTGYNSLLESSIAKVAGKQISLTDFVELKYSK